VEEARAQRSQGLGLKESVRAAGGVPVRRRGDGELEVLLVHRPKYSDWTFPKGKVKDGERDEVAAVREVEEETGLRCGLGPELASTHYTDPKLRQKTVRYWAMESCSGRFEPGDEVDEVAWLTPNAAARQLSYERDRDVLRSLAEAR
jgi:8-oxo-dGTP diphosphatase